MRADDGRHVMLYVNPHTEALVLASKLQQCRTYAFVVREQSLANDTPQLDLLSYDLRN